MILEFRLKEKGKRKTYTINDKKGTNTKTNLEKNMIIHPNSSKLRYEKVHTRKNSQMNSHYIPKTI